MANLPKKKRSKRGAAPPVRSEDVAEGSLAAAGPIFEPVDASGYVDMLGYSLAAGGWFFTGWIPRPLRIDQPQPVDCFVQFESSQFKGKGLLAFYQRDDLDRSRIGVIAFVAGSSRAMGGFRCLSITVDGVAYRVHVGESTTRLPDADLLALIRVTLVNQAFANANRDYLLGLISRPRFTGEDTLGALSEPVFLEIDEAIFCPPDGLLLKGWLLSSPGVIRSVRVRSGALLHEIDLNRSIAVNRPDVIDQVGVKFGFLNSRCGFIAFVPAASSSGDVSYIEIELTNGEIGFKCLRLSKRFGMDAIKRILDGVDVRYGEVDPAFDHVLGPAVAALNAARLKDRAAAMEKQFGPAAANPSCSVIIPLYGRMNFIEYQMALFSRHPRIADAEIIYVLDDPPKRRELEALARSVFERFEISFRLLLLPENLGFAPACNAGLQAARGEFICFLNSDVFPISADWMERLIERLRRKANLGVIGARLLYDDGSVQHEGCFFRPIEEFGNWMFIDHHNKGRRPADSAGLHSHEVITGACMLMRRTLALELGGFDESFVIGDFEDADLCLKIQERGMTCAIADDIELYHLERKSQVDPSQSWRQNLTLYNAWVHQRRWFEMRGQTYVRRESRA